MSFEPMNGHQDDYVLRGPGYGFEIHALETALTFLQPKPGLSLRTRFLGPRPQARIHAVGPFPFFTSYFIGSSASDWRTGIVNYSKVRVDGLYSGIDLIYYGASGKLEYDFVIHPGADPASIRFEISGADAIRVDDNGDLVLSSGGKYLRWQAPVLYQVIGSTRVEVSGRYVLSSNRRIRFQVDKYDRSRDLTIDPILSYASYLGGRGREWSRAVATDPAGNVYVTGLTSSTDLKNSSTAFQHAFAGQKAIGNTGGDAFVAKFSSAGALLYLTYLGGAADDLGFGIAADAAGNAYVTGMTNSTNFPVTQGAYQTTFGGSGGNICQHAGDAFITKINPTGTNLVYSTYLGGRFDDFGSAIAVDAAGNAYVTGFTISDNFPSTPGAYQRSLAGVGAQTGRPSCGGLPWFNTGDAFVTKLNPGGSQVVFSTYLGGRFDDAGLAIALDSEQNVFVGGFTLSINFPTTTGVLQSTNQGTDAQNIFFNTGDGFLSKLNNDGASLLYSTYLGGVGDDGITGIAALGDGTVWITGATSSPDFPVTANAFQRAFAGYQVLPFLVEQSTGDAFATHINAAATAILYSTYLGGSQNDLGGAIQVDASGLVYVSGFTDSSNFPVSSNAVQPKFGGDGDCNGRDLMCGIQYFQIGDGFVTVIDPNKSTLPFSTYLGGSRDDSMLGLALDGSGGVWAAGGTHSTDIPVSANAFQPINAGRTDSWLVHLTGLAATGPVLTALANAASNAGGAVSPGMIFVGYGSSIGPAVLEGASLDSSGKLATTQAGVTITFDGVPAPIVYVSANQVAGVVPYEVAGKTSTQVVVQNNGQDSAPLTVPVTAAAPGLFSANFSGSGAAVAFNQDNSLNSPSNPAKKGSIVVVYGTGEGETTPPGIDGEIAVPGSLVKPVLNCSGTVGGLPAAVLYCGSVPFVVEGELQVNLQLSAETPSGSQPVAIKLGSFTSQANLTISVQ